jgi:hypothetical protein
MSIYEQLSSGNKVKKWPLLAVGDSFGELASHLYDKIETNKMSYAPDIPG